MTLTGDIVARYCAIEHATIDERALSAARIALADGLAVMVAATGLEPSTRPFADYAAAALQGPSTLIGAGVKVSPVFAALANGALAHAIDFEDTFEEGMIHPNSSLIPAVLALAESENSTGEAVLAALALGCDFACRLSLALEGDPAKRGWYHPAILAGLGATLGCAVLLKLDADGMRNALGLFAAQFMLNDELKRSPRSDLRAVREGFAARGAVEAALLARAGVQAVDEPLEGKSGVFRLLTGEGPRESAFADIGERFWGPEVGVKRWPACRGTHSAIVVAQRLRERGISPADIEHVSVQAIPPNDMLFTPRQQRVTPQTAIDAKFSIPFVFAAAVSDGEVGLSSFADAAIREQAKLSLAEKVHFDRLLSGKSPEAIYDIQLADGTVITETVTEVPVWRARDIALAELSEKAGECLKLGRKPVELAPFLERVARISSDGAGPLMALL